MCLHTRVPIEAFETAPADDRKATLQPLQSRAESQPTSLNPLRPALIPFLADGEQSTIDMTAVCDSGM